MRALTTLLVLMLSTAVAAAADKVTYLFPTLDIVPAFAPFQIAKAKKYYESEGLDVVFQVGKGGADVAKQVAVGNADLGGGIGDTPIVVRPNDVPVRGVALLGGQALHQLVVRKDAGIKSLADLKGKKIGVVAFQDTSYYNLLAALASQGLDKSSADIQAVGVGGIVKLMQSGDLHAVCGAPEWAASIASVGTPVEMISLTGAFPAMAQAILASDQTIKTRPEVIRKFVRATLKAVRDIESDYRAAAKVYIAAVPQHAGKEAFIEEIFQHYATKVYPMNGGAKLGTFDRARVETVQKFYLANGIVSKAVPLDELFTNEFVQ